MVGEFQKPEDMDQLFFDKKEMFVRKLEIAISGEASGWYSFELDFV